MMMVKLVYRHYRYKLDLSSEQRTQKGTRHIKGEVTTRISSKFKNVKLELQRKSCYVVAVMSHFANSIAVM